MDVGADFCNSTDKLMPDMHGDRNRFPGPGIPIIDVHVRTANRRFVNLDQDIVDSYFGYRDILQPDTGFRFGFYQGFHFHGIVPFIMS
jgi:hypothetical protein